MKQSLRCPKCGHNRIIYISEVADQRDHGTASVAHLARVPSTQIMGLQTFSSAGELEAGVCRSCGYTEFYVKDPGSIPVDGQHIREVVGPEQPPYR